MVAPLMDSKQMPGALVVQVRISGALAPFGQVRTSASLSVIEDESVAVEAVANVQ